MFQLAGFPKEPCKRRLRATAYHVGVHGPSGFGSVWSHCIRAEVVHNAELD